MPLGCLLEGIFGKKRKILPPKLGPRRGPRGTKNGQKRVLVLRSLLGLNFTSTWGGFWDDFGCFLESSCGKFWHAFKVVSSCGLLGLLALLKFKYTML